MALCMVWKRRDFNSFFRYYPVIFANISHRNGVSHVRNYSLRSAFQFKPFASCTTNLNVILNPIAGHVWNQSGYWYSKKAENEESVDLTFEQVQNLMKSEPTLIVDVREPTELVEFGQYEDAVNIPLGQLEEAFKLSDKDFRKRFGVDKPSVEDENIVFCCLAGIRSFKAVQIALNLGFSRARNYKGGWEDYHKRMGLPFKRISNK